MRLLFSWTASFPCFRDGYAGCGEAVQDGDPDLERGNLSVEVPGSRMLAPAGSRNASSFRRGSGGDGRSIVAGRFARSGGTRRVSLRAIAPGVSGFSWTGFHGRAFLRGGMTAAAPRAAMASWHLRVSKAPSAVTLAIS